jgi:septum formation protein
MIVFLPFGVKNKEKKVQVWQALRVIARRLSAASQVRNTVLVLASSSAYRRSLLDRLHLPYSVVAPNIDETALLGERPAATALRLAESKTRAVSAAFPARIIIGSDQIAVLGSQPLGKPGTHPAALAQLMAMRGRSVVFHTALCVLDAATGQCQLENVPTTVTLRDYSEAQAVRYLERDRPYDCAGSAKIEAMGIALVERVVSNDPTALIGLPLIALVTMLKRAGVEVL